LTPDTAKRVLSSAAARFVCLLCLACLGLAAQTAPQGWHVAHGLNAAALADFNGDRHTDSATAELFGFAEGAYRYRVHVGLSGSQPTQFWVLSHAAGLSISAQDIDGDHDLDLVITTRFGRERVGVWINDGKGGFAPGDASAYSPSIWLPIDRFLSLPGPHASGTPVVGMPAAGWAVPQPSGAVSMVPLFACPRQPDRCFRSSTPNRNNPFRAPPRSA
jgi:hypothetical protein